MLNRRKLIHGSAFMAAAMTTPGIYAEELVKTAESTEGPFILTSFHWIPITTF